jgi:hypothetical protein
MEMESARIFIRKQLCFLGDMRQLLFDHFIILKPGMLVALSRLKDGNPPSWPCQIALSSLGI